MKKYCKLVLFITFGVVLPSFGAFANHDDPPETKEITYALHYPEEQWNKMSGFIMRLKVHDAYDGIFQIQNYPTGPDSQSGYVENIPIEGWDLDHGYAIPTQEIRAKIENWIKSKSVQLWLSEEAAWRSEFESLFGNEVLAIKRVGSRLFAEFAARGECIAHMHLRVKPDAAIKSVDEYLALRKQDEHLYHLVSSHFVIRYDNRPPVELTSDQVAKMTKTDFDALFAGTTPLPSMINPRNWIWFVGAPAVGLFIFALIFTNQRQRQKS